jgi:maltooligosyltrehalose trehalohydrolase
MMEPMNISERSIGVNFAASGEAYVLLWAPQAKRVSMELLRTSESLDLKPKGCGYWHLTTTAVRPGDLYYFLLDDRKQLSDPASLAQPLGVHGASQAVDLRDFEWTDQEWRNPSLEDYILYELHTGTFTPAGTFQGIEEKLGYLKELGITAIEIMPVAQFPGECNWGYDGVFPFAVQHSYGGARALQHLVNSCHRQGLAVILDVVYNHLGPEGNYLDGAAPYFTSNYKTPWGKAVNFDDAWCDGVRHYVIENALMWFRDFHIDALRLDAVHAIKDLSATHILKELRTNVDLLSNQRWSSHYLIVESDLNDPKYITTTEKNGYGMHAQWVDEFHHALRVAAGQERTGYYADFDGLRHLAKSYQDAYVFDGQYSAHRLRHFGAKADNLDGHQFIVFSQNHDQVGNRLLGERTSQLVSFEMCKLMAGATLVSPYLPMLFMGEEYGETNPFLYFTSHTDPELVENIRKGRKAEFAAFHMGDAPDPQTEETFYASKLQWRSLYMGQHQAMLGFYQQLIALRKENPALRHLSRKKLTVQCDEATQMLQLHRWHGDQHVLCAMNFSAESQYLDLDPQLGWRKALDSADAAWHGPRKRERPLENAQQVRLHPQSILILTRQHV